MHVRPALIAPLVVALAAFAAVLLSCGSTPELPATATPTPGPSERFQTPRTLNSYRFEVRVCVDSGIVDQSEAPPGLELSDEPVEIRIDGWWMSPNQEYSSAAFSFGVLQATLETTRIGDQVWTRVEGGAWREQAPLTDPENLIGQDVPLTPDALFGRDDPEVLARLTADLDARAHTLEVVDGRQTRHWSLDEEWFDAYIDEFVDVLSGISRDQGLLLDIDLWSDTETGVGTRLRVIGGFPGQPDVLELDLRMFDIDDPSIVVKEPIGAIGR